MTIPVHRCVDELPGAGRPANGLVDQMLMVTGCTSQMSSQYSTMARSDENFALRAVLRMDIRVQAD
jgi:hypothetical protein